MDITRSQAFFQGLNPYTGEELTQRMAAAAATSEASGSSWNAAPVDQYQRPQESARQVNPNDVLTPLYSAQQELSKAKSGMDKVGQFWNRVSGEVGSAESQTSRAQSDLYPAESDTEETDHSRTGSMVSSSLSQIESALSRLTSDASTPSYAIFEVKQQLSAAQSFLNSVDASRLPYPFKHQQAVQNLNDFQSRLYRIEQAQTQLEGKLGYLQSPMSSARYDINAVASDRDGVSVAYQARSARGHLGTLAGQLRDVQQHLNYSTGDLSQAQSALTTAEQSVQTAHQEYQHSWHTSDKRA